LWTISIRIHQTLVYLAPWVFLRVLGFGPLNPQNQIHVRLPRDGPRLMLSSSAPTKPRGRSHYRPGYSAAPAAPEAISSIGSGLSIVGKIVGHGALVIFGHVEGELHASTIQISDGAQVEGNIVAEELTIGGHVKGTIHANRVKLNSTAVVEGDIFHRSLAIEENAQFEGMSRRQENVIHTRSHVPANLPQAQAVSMDGNRKDDGVPGERMQHADLGGAAVTTAGACVAAVVVALIGVVVLNSIQESAEQAFTTSAVRLSR
jgi:cytoskeletal protein CcmA (bactofilin family)